VRIVALQAIRRSERLVLVRLLQIRVLRIVTGDAERWCRFRQVKQIFCRGFSTGLVRCVAGVAAHIERGVTAAFLWNVGSLRVARKTEVVLLVARSCFQQLKLVVGGMWIVTRQAIANRRLVDPPLDLFRIFFGVAGKAELVRNRGDQLDARHVFAHADLMAAQAAGCDRRVHRLPFGFVFVTLEALRGIGVLIERNRVNRRGHARRGKQSQKEDANANLEFAAKRQTCRGKCLPLEVPGELGGCGHSISICSCARA